MRVKLDKLITDRSFKKGSKQRYFPQRGGMEVALKRVLSNAGAHALGLVLAVDVHRTTVTRKEFELRAAMVSSAQQFRKEHKTYSF